MTIPNAEQIVDEEIDKLQKMIEDLEKKIEENQREALAIYLNECAYPHGSKEEREFILRRHEFESKINTLAVQLDNCRIREDTLQIFRRKINSPDKQKIINRYLERLTKARIDKEDES